MSEDQEPHQSTPKANEKAVPTIGQELKAFLHHADALISTFPLVMLVMAGHCKATSSAFLQFLELNGTPVPQKPSAYALKPEYHREADRLGRISHHAQISNDILPRSFLVALVSHYDFYLSRLIRCLYLLQPEKLNSSEKAMTFAELLKFSSIQSAREYVLEKEIESVLRTSHSDQFDWLARKFGVSTLTKGLDIWSQFIEITERRNLFVHCHGVVSSQYRAVCAAHNVKGIADLGVQLDVDLEYFTAGHKCFTELATKLAHVLWRVVAPHDRDAADTSFNSTLYELVSEGRYEMAIKLGEVALDTLLRTESAEATRRMIIINVAQSHKWCGDQARAIATVSKVDWSATGDVFQLALAVLKDDFVRAATMMKRIGKDGDMKEDGYQNWPVFREFRKSEVFADTYKEVFGKPFVAVEVSALSVRNVLTKAGDTISGVLDQSDYAI